MILGIEAGVRMHQHFRRLIDTFANFKADADAGPLDNNTDPATAKLAQDGFFAHEIFTHGQDSGRARQVRGGRNHAHHPPAHQVPIDDN